MLLDILLYNGSGMPGVKAVRGVMPDFCLDKKASFKHKERRNFFKYPRSCLDENFASP